LAVPGHCALREVFGKKKSQRAVKFALEKPLPGGTKIRRPILVCRDHRYRKRRGEGEVGIKTLKKKTAGLPTGIGGMGVKYDTSGGDKIGFPPLSKDQKTRWVKKGARDWLGTGQRRKDRPICLILHYPVPVKK